MNKHFYWQIHCILFTTFSIGLSHGLLFAAKLAENPLEWTQIPLTIIPIHIHVILCYACSRCGEISKNLSMILMQKCSEEFRDTKLVESYSLQVEMQKIQFEPRNLYIFDIDFLMEAVRFLLDYDIVFMQFYFT
jgi:uncharacterized protein YacL